MRLLIRAITIFADFLFRSHARNKYTPPKIPRILMNKNMFFAKSLGKEEVIRAAIDVKAVEIKKIAKFS